jgi:hypothetical protein
MPAFAGMTTEFVKRTETAAPLLRQTIDGRRRQLAAAAVAGSGTTKR